MNRLRTVWTLANPVWKKSIICAVLCLPSVWMLATGDHDLSPSGLGTGLADLFITIGNYARG